MTPGKQIALIFFVIPIISKGQHRTTHTNMLWLGYYQTIQFNKNWSLLSDAQLRIREWTDEWSQILVRSGLNYSFNDKSAVTGGFSFFKNAHYEKTSLLKNEWRPWQEFSCQLKSGKINLTQRLRTEERFLQQVVDKNLSDQYEYVFRLRYRVDGHVSLNKDFKLGIGNEVLVNPGYFQNTRFFDQDRLFVGIYYSIRLSTIIQLQYLKIFQWRSNLNEIEDQNNIRINVIKKIYINKTL